MIRSTELLPYLETISRVLTHELRPELQSGQAKKSADYLIEAVNRLAGQMRDGERLGADHLSEWRELRQEVVPSATAVAGAASGQLGALTAEAERVEALLRTDQGMASFVRRLTERQPEATRWLSKASAASAKIWEAFEEAYRPAPAPEKSAGFAPDPADLRVRLGNYLKRKYPGLPNDPIVSFRISPGGSTKLTALFSLRANTLVPEHLVLRMDLPLNLTNAKVADEFPVVHRLFKLGLRVPEPILLESDPGFTGGAFMIMTEIVGAVPAGTYFAKDRAQQPFMIGPDFARDAAEELARLHVMTEVEVSDGPARAAAHTAGVEAAHQRWNAIAKPPHALGMDLAFAWLKANPLGSDRPRCLVHGDYSVHNMMARDKRLAAVLDWELAEENDPAIDLAEARMLLAEDTLPWDEFVRSYLGAGGSAQACDPKAVTYYCVWMYSVKYGMMMAEARNAFLSGARADSLMASVASHSMDRILLYLARSLELAVSGK